MLWRERADRAQPARLRVALAGSAGLRVDSARSRCRRRWPTGAAPPASQPSPAVPPKFVLVAPDQKIILKPDNFDLKQVLIMQPASHERIGGCIPLILCCV